jgi:glycosyltransferase involved in cell wall biosynthesis
MIHVRDLVGLAHDVSPEAAPDPLLSVVLLCGHPQELSLARVAVECLFPPSDELGVTILIEPGPLASLPPDELAPWAADKGCRVLVPQSPCGLNALRFDQGILASSGRWLWLLDASRPLPRLDIRVLLSRLRAAEDQTVLVIVNPEDRGRLGSVRGVGTLWLDLFYKGWQFPFENVLFPRAVFRRHGLLDPHVVMTRFFQEEFLIRIGRYVGFEKQDEESAGRLTQIRLPRLFHHWAEIDRRRLLAFDRFGDYSVDDLRWLHGRVPDQESWSAYLERVLPYYHAHRPFLPEGFPLTACSSPPPERHFMCVKTDHYSTTTDVGVRNFDVFAQGERGFKLSYAYAGQIGEEDVPSTDALLLLRTVEDNALGLARRSSARGVPVGYTLDDDLLNISQMGGEFASFRAGNPAYDAMVETLPVADVVLCGGPHVEGTVKGLNPRTVHFEGSVLPEFLPGTPRRSRGRPFRFGYAGGSYRREEMELLSPAIERICLEYGSGVEFQFWGIEPPELLARRPQVSSVSFTINYYEYLSRLRAAGFDAMLVPLLYDPPPRRGKVPNKLYETAVAGAVGLFSDVPTYAVARDNALGLLVAEDARAWYEAMRRVLEQSEEEHLTLRNRLLDFVREFYTTPAMLPVHEHGLHAILFHAATRRSRAADGRPRVLYLFPEDGPGAAAPREALLRLAVESGIAPLTAVTPVGEAPSDALRARLSTRPGEPAPCLVHALGLQPGLVDLCRSQGVPLVLVPDGAPRLPPPGRVSGVAGMVVADTIASAAEWSSLLGLPWYCARGVVAEHAFQSGFAQLHDRFEASDRGAGDTLRVGVSGVDGREELREVFGMGAYLARGGPSVELVDVNEGDAGDGVRGLDILLDLSTGRGFSSPVKAAAASGTLVITSPGTGAAELIHDDTHGIVTCLSGRRAIAAALQRASSLLPEDSLRLRRHAFSMARQEFHPRRARLDLLSMYNLALSRV